MRRAVFHNIKLKSRITIARAAGAAIIGALCLAPTPIAAETMSGALALAYGGNPDMNQQRAGVRATDETLPQASSSWRPSASVSADAGYNYLDYTQADGLTRKRTGSLPRTVSLTVNQTVYNGNRTINGVRQAESNIMGARENLRNTELNVLLNGATVYMNVLRDTAILDLRRNNITVLEEQLRQTRDRFNVGEVTRTDVAQAEASLANARSDYFAAQANLQTSIANFRQVIGIQPTKLEPARTIESLLPRNVDTAVLVGLSEHPVIQSALHSVDAAALQVKLVEGELYPTVGLVGNVQASGAYSGFPKEQLLNAQVLGQITVPIYSGGDVYARARQAKETLGQARIQADLERDSVRAGVVSSWGQLDSAKAVIQSARAAVKAAEIALDGVREEAKVGQRTTFDVLQQQQILLNTRVSLVTAQRDRVVASYAVMAAIGRLSAANLNLNVVQYDPTVHFDQVKDKWIGLRTPDGR
ncbi:TolC family outer membrane protein [Methylocapsa acidiphila]|uniref:TolC family outer membrane protein n=1 Tax=Methylocapsa acidiphila TaxID=133552 RepID=UPI0004134B77|nr:TolC family outer membrane protein [Methylocapsa acidiphila]